ncbi:hypothetical protein [Salinarimonas soli]|uniref:Lipoprotein n=1 Tax=Salinarimonas soli TaxID=1638099 RepID=A0A5B2VCF7_9HYPH|nr:hypothetical protein [Salinarimonas soli]KAA2236425.1 hypothetical protein F0L46_14885 [Salinarimonas soli]
MRNVITLALFSLSLGACEPLKPKPLVLECTYSGNVFYMRQNRFFLVLEDGTARASITADYAMSSAPTRVPIDISTDTVASTTPFTGNTYDDLKGKTIRLDRSSGRLDAISVDRRHEDWRCLPFRQAF